MAEISTEYLVQETRLGGQAVLALLQAAGHVLVNGRQQLAHRLRVGGGLCHKIGDRGLLV